MNWPSASFIAHVDKYILETAFGCEVELVPGDTERTTRTLLGSQFPDITPELWAASAVEDMELAFKDEKLHLASEVLSDGGESGFWVPRYMVDSVPEIQTIRGIIANKDIFEIDGQARFYGCPEGWNCRISSRNIYKALKLEEAGFILVEPESGEALLQSIVDAFTKKESWFGYYWAPTAVLGRYPMVKILISETTDAQHYFDCITQADCENPRATNYPSSPVYTIAAEPFASQNPEIVSYLQKRTFSNIQMNNLLAGMDGRLDRMDQDTLWFLENYSLMWAQWLPSDKAQIVWQSLQ
jgi:glycine betaine/proline transport system substrate-binding protein